MTPTDDGDGFNMADIDKRATALCRDAGLSDDYIPVVAQHLMPDPSNTYPYTIPGHPGPEYFAGLPEKYQNNTISPSPQGDAGERQHTKNCAVHANPYLPPACDCGAATKPSTDIAGVKETLRGTAGFYRERPCVEVAKRPPTLEEITDRECNDIADKLAEALRVIEGLEERAEMCERFELRHRKQIDVLIGEKRIRDIALTEAQARCERLEKEREADLQSMSSAYGDIVGYQNTIERLTAALETIRDGIPVVRAEFYRKDGVISKCDKCPHDRYVYEGCDDCISEYARAALTGRGE
jgi:hypothetical protein